jgi:hypothetical protein
MPTLRWAGCVVFPSNLILNAVAPTSDGSLVVTSMLDRNDKDAFKKMISGGIIGVVYRWKPGTHPTPLKGTEASVDNGIEVARTARSMSHGDTQQFKPAQISCTGRSCPC